MAYRRKTRTKLRLRTRERYPVTRSVQEFQPGQSVHIRIDPSFHKGLPHPRFEGRTGKVLGQRGRAFMVQIRDGRTLKTLLTRPEHLSPGGGGQSPPLQAHLAVRPASPLGKSAVHRPTPHPPKAGGVAP